jgi:hypothetical protein
MKYIITESQSNRIKFLRRFSEIDDAVEKLMNTNEPIEICDQDFNSFFGLLKYGIVYEFFDYYFSNDEIEIDERKKFKELIEKHLEHKHKERLEKFYNEFCNLS